MKLSEGDIMLENGRKTARLDTVFSLADALGIKPSELIRMVEEDEKRVAKPDTMI